MARSRRVVVVTGVSGTLGTAIAARAARDGWTVVGVDRRDEARSRHHVVGDVADPATHDAAVAAAAKAGRLTAWVNNAGVTEDVPLHEAPLEVIDGTLDSNLRGTLLGSRAALAHFVETGTGGVIVNMSSIHGRAGFPRTGVYDATKGGVEALTRHIASEYGHLGIRANALAPGAIRNAPMQAAIDAAPDPAAREASWAALHPLGRVGEPDDVAAAVAYLLSDDSSFVSGAVLPVDGGSAARVFPYPPFGRA